jgi:hypothetical protein
MGHVLLTYLDILQHLGENLENLLTRYQTEVKTFSWFWVFMACLVSIHWQNKIDVEPNIYWLRATDDVEQKSSLWIKTFFPQLFSQQLNCTVQGLLTRILSDKTVSKQLNFDVIIERNFTKLVIKVACSLLKWDRCIESPAWQKMLAVTHLDFSYNNFIISLWRTTRYSSASNAFSTTHPSRNCVVAGANNGYVQEWCTRDQSNTAYQRISFRSDFPQHASSIAANEDSSDTSNACDHTEY